MSLLDDSCEFDAQLDFAPLVQSSVVVGMSTPTRQMLPPPAAQETPFTAALRAFSTSTAPPVPPLPRAFSAATPPPATTPEVLINFALTPSPSSHRPPPIFAQPRPQHSPRPRSLSPLKQVSFDLSGDDEREDFQSPFARDAPGTARKLSRARADEDGEAVSPTTRRASGGGRKWSVMSKVRDEQRRARSRSVSPVKDAGSSLAPVLEDAESSFAFSPFGNTSDEYSLIVDERGSFLVDSADFTLASFSLPSVAEADEGDSTADMSHLLRGLGDSLVGGRPPPRLGVLPTLHEKASTESLFPTDESPVERSFLASSTASYRDYRDSPSKPRPVQSLAVRPIQPKLSTDSLFPPDGLAESSERSFLASSTASYHDHRVKPAYSTDSLRSVIGERSLLASSTASYIDHRDSPKKGRVVSFAFDDDQKTPVRLRRDQIASGSESSGGSTSDVRNMLSDWRDDGGSTGEINDQDPPTGLLKPEPTLTFEMGLQSPIRPSAAPSTALSPKSLFSTMKANAQRPLHRVAVGSPRRAIVASSSSPDLITLDAPPASTKPTLTRSESGTDRLRKKIEELNKKRQAPLPIPILPTALPASAPRPVATRRALPSPATRVSPTTRPAPSSAPRALTRPRPSLSALPPPRPTHRRLESIPDTDPESGAESAKENAPPSKLSHVNVSPRKESTRDRLERAKEEREERKRRPPVASTSRLPPAASLADALARPRPTSLASRSQFNPLGASRASAPINPLASAKPTKPVAKPRTSLLLAPAAKASAAIKGPRTSLLPASAAAKPRSSLLPAPRQSLVPPREPSPTKSRGLRRPSAIGTTAGRL